MTVKIKALATAISLCTAFATFPANAAVDAALPDYERASGISGNLTSIGSDTLANLMTLWAQEFKKNYPNVNVQIQAEIGRAHV